MRRHKSNTYRFRIMNYLFYVCVIPARSLRIIGNSVQTVQRTVRDMKKEGWLKAGKSYEKRYIVLGKPISFFESYEEQYFDGYKSQHGRLRNRYYRKEQTSENKQKFQRLLQLAESSVFLGESGISVIPSTKPCLQFVKRYWDEPTFYQSLEIKELMDADESRATGSRSTGCICWNNEISTVFSLSDDIIKIGEITEKLHVERLYSFFSKKVGEVKVEDAYLFTWKYNKVHEKLGLKNRFASYFYLDDTYQNYYLIPYTQEGKELLNLLYSPFAKEELRDMIIKQKWKTSGQEDIEIDGIDENGVLIFNYLIPNILRFKKFVSAAHRLTGKDFHVYCYDFQEEAVKKELTSNMTYSVFRFEEVKELYEKRYERRMMRAYGQNEEMV